MKKLLILLFSIYVSSLSAQWEKLNAPGIASNIELAKSNGYLFAVSDFSLLRRSASNGLSWQSTVSPIPIYSLDYKKYQSIDADDNLLAVLILGENGVSQVFQSTDYGDNWTQLPGSPLSNFADDKIYVHQGEVYMNANGELYHFSSGSWNIVPTFVTNFVKAFTFKNNQIWMSTYQKMQYSNDMGATWQDVVIPFISAHSIASDGNGILAAAENFIYYSADDGLNWQQRGISSSFGTNVISHDGIGYVTQSDLVYRSIDGFLNYNLILNGHGVVRDIHELNGYWVAGTGHGIYVTAANPSDWQWVSSGIAGTQFNNMLDATDGTLFYTNTQTAFSTDEGNSWQVTKDRHRFIDFLYNNNTSTWHALKNHQIWQSTNLTDWTLQSTPAIDTFYNLFWAYSGSSMVYCSQASGSPILYSNDDGTTWATGGSLPTNGELVLSYNGYLYAHVLDKLMRSNDFGLNWTEVGINALAADPGVSMFHQDPSGKFYALSFSNILVSNDAGVNWTPQSLASINPGFIVEGSAVFNGKVVLEVQQTFDPTTHTIFMTDDDGLNWKPIMLGYTDITRGNLVWTGNNLFDLGDYTYPWRRSNFNVSASQYSGLVYRDVISNGQYDIGEPLLPNVLLHMSNTSQSTNTNAFGTFNIFAETQNDVITAVSPGKYCTFTPPNYAVNPTDTHLDFALNCPAGTTDLSVNMYNNPFRPGFDTDISVFVKNEGNDIADGTLTLTLQSGLGLTVGSTTPAATQVGNVLSWPISSLPSLDHLYFSVRVNTPAGTVLGTQICNDAEVVVTSATDAFSSDNTATMCRTVVGSFDPNDKAVDKAAYKPGTQPPLAYTVRFQNTGTYLASFVVIRDTLSPNLDPATLQILGSSHPLTWSLRGNGIIEFRFDGINLPDMNTDEPGSHGFVQFSVQPRENQPLGLMTQNTAFIYFDFNEPIITNTVTSTVLKTQEPSNLIQLLVQPNPAFESLVILWPDGQTPGDMVLSLHDVSGKLVQVIPVSPHQDLRIDVRNLKSGAYQLSGNDGKRFYSARFEVIR